MHDALELPNWNVFLFIHDSWIIMKAHFKTTDIGYHGEWLSYYFNDFAKWNRTLFVLCGLVNEMENIRKTAISVWRDQFKIEQLLNIYLQFPMWAHSSFISLKMFFMRQSKRLKNDRFARDQFRLFILPSMYMYKFFWAIVVTNLNTRIQSPNNNTKLAVSVFSNFTLNK